MNDEKLDEILGQVRDTLAQLDEVRVDMQVRIAKKDGSFLLEAPEGDLITNLQNIHATIGLLEQADDFLCKTSYSTLENFEGPKVAAA